MSALGARAGGGAGHQRGQHLHHLRLRQLHQPEHGALHQQPPRRRRGRRGPEGGRGVCAAVARGQRGGGDVLADDEPGVAAAAELHAGPLLPGHQVGDPGPGARPLPRPRPAHQEGAGEDHQPGD